MKTIIVIHETFEEALKNHRLPAVKQVFVASSTEVEHAQYKEEFYSPSNGLSYKNVALDLCWHVEDDYATRIASSYLQKCINENAKNEQEKNEK